MEKRLRRWRRNSLALILYTLTVSPFWLLAGFCTSSDPNEYGSIFLFFLNPTLPILTLFSLLSRGAEETPVIQALCLLIPITDSLLLLLGWRLAAKNKQSGSVITVVSAITHLVLHIFLFLAFLPAVLITIPYFVFPVLLLRGYFQWQPPLRK